jgi:hypothetical protein
VCIPARPAIILARIPRAFSRTRSRRIRALGGRVHRRALEAPKKGTIVSNDIDVRPPDTRAVRRRVTLADRIALRIGMSLIIWSRRTHRVRPSVDFATRQRLDRERRERELDLLVRTAAMRMWR